MDKAYLDFDALYKLHEANCFFVTRPKSPLRYEVVERNYNINEAVGIVGDCVIHLTGYKSKTLYPENLRWLSICMLKIVEVSILSKTDIRELIHAPELLTINQDVNELTIF